MASHTALAADELERLVQRLATSNKAQRRTLATRIHNILEAGSDEARLQKMSAAVLATDVCI